MKLIDRDGHTVKMTKEDIAESLKKMGNPLGVYQLVPRDWDRKPHEFVVFLFRPSQLPKYSWFQKQVKEWKWNRKQKQMENWFKVNNPKNLIWKPTPFVLEAPWLRLKGKKAVTINVE